MPFKNYAAVTDVGRQRNNNEDTFLAKPLAGLWLVADGMGGHAAGEIASGIVAKTIEAEINNGHPLSKSVQMAHYAVLDAAASGVGGQGMGSTVVALNSQKTEYEIAWVGDSRAYLWNTEQHDNAFELLQLTSDHSYVQMLYESGAINADELHDHPEKNIITQCLGSLDLDDVRVDTMRGRWQPHQWILLCSDGLNDTITDEEIAATLREAGANIQQACSDLVQRALDGGGRDNITLIVISRPNKWVSLAVDVHKKVMSRIRRAAPGLDLHTPRKSET